MPQDENKETIFELTDVEVDTLGLVTRGANRENFFILKEEGDAENTTVDKNQMQTPDQSEMEAKIAKSVWQKLIGLFKKGIAEPELLETQETTTIGELIPVPLELSLTGEDIVQDEAKQAEKQEIVETQVEELISEETVKTEEGDATMPEEYISKAEFEKAQSELNAIRAELAKANEEKEQLVWLTKADQFGYAPVASTELAKHLFAISKLDANEAIWLVDLLKAYDAMLGDSGMFVEKGSAMVPVDEVEKALQSTNPREALLGLDAKVANEYLSNMRNASRR